MKSQEYRFWNKVQKTDSCWNWTGATTYGYGVMGRGRSDEGIMRAHRFSWELHIGPIPNGLWVLHHCDNPSCVNPEHLFLGTQTDNMQDASRKGRLNVSKGAGEANVRAKLTWGKVFAIREARVAGSTFQRIADAFGISNSQAQRVAKQQQGGWL